MFSIASQARKVLAGSASRLGIPQMRSLVVSSRLKLPEEALPRRDLQEIQNCYIDFVSPKEIQVWNLGGRVRCDDYTVLGIDRQTHPLTKIVGTGKTYWIDSRVVGSEIEGGFSCDLLTYRESALTISLFLRQREDERG